MRINALRQELAAMLSALPACRAPALRRSIREEWIYATDLPMILSGREAELLRKKLTAAGWEYTEESGWLLLRKPAEEPPEDWYEGAFGPEAACCASLLRRHPAEPEADPQAIQRMLIKAGEEGTKAYEEACAKLHEAWAARLREGYALPAISRKYFGQ